jgi:DNA-binding Lrp family transcriptional regulator
MKFLNTYYHPVLKRNNFVCGDCWNKINKTEAKYSKFISNEISKESGGCPCFVLIKTLTGKEKFVSNKLTEIQKIEEINHLLGGYDIIIKLKIEDITKLDDLVTGKIRKINGIKKTMTLTGAHSLKGI